MFDSKTVRNNIITIDRDAMWDRVVAIHNISSDVMISAPQPCVINDHISRVDGNHFMYSHLVDILVCRASYSAEDIAGNSWILRRALELSIGTTPL